MKTVVKFQNTIQFISIFVNSKKVTRFKAFVAESGGKITEATEHRENDEYYFCVENIPYYLLIMLKAENRIHHYTLSISDNVRVDFRNDSKNMIEFIKIKFRNGNYKTGEERWQERIHIYGKKKEILDKNYDRYEMNWMGIGTVSVEDATEFATALNIAVILANECQMQFVNPQK